MPKAHPPPPKWVKKLHEVPVGTLREWGQASGERFDIGAATTVYKLRVRNEAGVKKKTKGCKGPCGQFHKYNEGVNGMNAGHLLEVCIKNLCEEKVHRIEISDEARMKLVNDIQAIQHFAVEYKREDKAEQKKKKKSTSPIANTHTDRETNVQMTTMKSTSGDPPVHPRSPFISSLPSVQASPEKPTPPSSDSDVYYTANTHPATSSDDATSSDGGIDLNSFGGPISSPIRSTRIVAPLPRKWPRPCVPFLGFEDDDTFIPKQVGIPKSDRQEMPQFLDGDSGDDFPAISDLIKEKKKKHMFIDVTTPKRPSKRTAATEPPARQKKFRPATIIEDVKPKPRAPAILKNTGSSNVGDRAGPSAPLIPRGSLKPRIMDKTFYREVIEILDSP